MALQRGDDGTREVVVGGDRRVDLVVVLREHLLEDRQPLLGIPVRPLVAALALREGALLVQGVQYRVVPLLEELGIVIRDAPVQLDEDWMLRVVPVRLEGRDKTLSHRLPDHDVVERHVVRGLPVQHESVVVDRLRSLCRRR